MFMPTLKEFRDEAEMSLSELARRANVDYKTAKRAEEGEQIKRNKAAALVRALSKTLGRQLKLEDVEDLHIVE